MNDALINALHMAHKAGLIRYGEACFRNPKAMVAFVLIPTDLSPRHQKDVLYTLTLKHIPYRIALTKAILEGIAKRKQISFIGVADPGFAKKLREME